jgi:outer membrane lipopolysaccharide assembly protein LptE/RlpB
MRPERAPGRTLVVGILLAILPLAGCGYNLVGRGRTKLPAHITTIAVPLFGNRTLEPELEKDVTGAVREAFIRDGRLKVVDSERAVSLLEGQLRGYTLEAVAFDIQDRVTQYRVVIGVHITYKDTVNDKVLIDQDFSAREEFQVSTAITSREAAKVSSRKVAADELAEQLVNLILEGF